MPRPEATESRFKLGLMPTLFATVAALYFAQEVLIPLAVAVLLAFLLTPAVNWLEGLRLGRVAPVLISIVTALALVGSIGWLVERQFVELAERLPDYSDNIQNKFQRFHSSAGGSFSKAARGVEETIKNMAGSAPTTRPSVLIGPAHSTGSFELPVNAPAMPKVSAQSPLPVREYAEPSSPMQIAGQFIQRLMSPLATCGLIIVFVVFMLLKRQDLRDRMIRLVGHGRLNLTTQALDDATTRISRYLLMQSAVNTIYGLCVGLGLWTIGAFSAEGRFPNILLWALLSIVLRFIPYVGPLIGAAVPVILSLAVFKSAGVFAETLCMYLGIELVTTNVLEPWLYGSSTGLSVVAILLSAVFWTWLWGPIGLLLSTPLTVCVVVLGKYVPHLEFLDVILGDEPVLEPSARVYQRLLSLDQEEASDLLHAWRKELGLEAVYDQILIPALAMAEQDRLAGNVDAAAELFIRQALRDLIEELGAAQKKDDSGEAAKPTDAPAPPREQPVTVLCLPAYNEADEIVGLMLCQLLEMKGQRAIAVSKVSLASEMLDLVEAQHAAVVCISALPPAALAHSRYLCKRLDARFPDLHTVVGLWTSKRDPQKSLDRLACEGHLSLVTSLPAAIAQIYQMIQPTLFQKPSAEPPTDQPLEALAVAP